eukprot:Nitzschia sp. Nitz4//scaffold436_size7492//3887//4998//NITZ4_009155-RA/size7492-snap-gene-0.12-mRNA-1//1//CDS//3329551845//8146//frame0
MESIVFFALIRCDDAVSLFLSNRYFLPLHWLCGVLCLSPPKGCLDTTFLDLGAVPTSPVIKTHRIMTWLQLAQRTAIVTGAGSGIGAAVARALAAEQCNVVLADRDLKAMEATSKDILKSLPPSEFPVSTLCVECNVTNPESVFSLVQQADEFASDLESPFAEKVATMLVNCAGITRDNWAAKMSMEEWDAVIDVNLKGTFLPCRAFLDQDRMKGMSELGTPPQMSIVNVGSIVSEFGNMGQANYSASKGAVIAMSRTLAKESAARNVRVNTVLPGFINTPMAHAVPDPVKDIVRSRTPLGRFGDPEEVSNLVNFLLSPRSSYITGETIRVTGMLSL